MAIIVKIAMMVAIGLLLSKQAYAGDYICAMDGTLVDYIHSTDPSVALCPPGSTRLEVTEGIMVQRALVQSKPRRYLRVVNGAVVELTAEEKAAVDAPLVAEQAKIDAARNEVVNQNVCNIEHLDQVNSHLLALRTTIYADIDTVTSFATNKATMKRMVDELLGIDQKIGRCLIAIIKLLGVKG